MVILEAMACGVVVVAHRVGDVEALIDHEINGMLVSPQDPDGFAEAVLKLEDNAFRFKLRTQALQKAQSFSDTVMAEHYQHLIHTLK